jgi:hypothetical protein
VVDESSKVALRINRGLGEDEDPDVFAADMEHMRKKLRDTGVEESDDALLAIAITTLCQQGMTTWRR